MTTLELAQLLGSYGEFVSAIAVVISRRRVTEVDTGWAFSIITTWNPW